MSGLPGFGYVGIGFGFLSQSEQHSDLQSAFMPSSSDSQVLITDGSHPMMYSVPMLPGGVPSAQPAALPAGLHVRQYTRQSVAIHEQDSVPTSQQ